MGHSSKECAEELFKKFQRQVTPGAIQGVCNRYGFVGKLRNDTQFKKGHISWNTGKKMSGSIRQKLIDSNNPLFIKGPNRPTPTAQPVGTERVNKDGYIEIKIPRWNPLCCKGKNLDGSSWILKHHKIWLEHGGRMLNTRKEAIVFLDGNRRNFDINNLKLVSRRALSRMSKNNRWSDIKEIKESYLLLSEMESSIVVDKK